VLADEWGVDARRDVVLETVADAVMKRLSRWNHSCVVAPARAGLVPYARSPAARR
jgi:hypothetical protein